MPTITVDGVEYEPVRKSGERRVIIICDNRGLTFVGWANLDGDSERVVIRDARCIIRWGTKKHLAEIAAGPTSDTILGACATVEVFRANLVAVYEAGEAWDNA